MRRFLFVGVSTGASAVTKLFPQWADILGVDWELEGVDIPLGSGPERYARLRTQFSIPDVVGGLITTHKAAMFRYQRHEFDLLEPLCASLGEIGLVFRGGSLLCGGVSDVTSGGAILHELLSSQRWLDGDRVAIVLGAGGAGLAAAWNLGSRGMGAPSRVVLVETDSVRRAEVDNLLRTWPLTCPTEVVDAGADHIVSTSGSAPLIVNATGMGKDRSGSPLSVPFPRGSTIWEFNYRGTLEFLAQARAEADTGELALHDGLRYFAAGWSVVMSKVAALPWTTEVFEQFLAVAGIPTSS